MTTIRGAVASADPPNLSVLMTPAQVSAYLGVPTGTLANWRYQGHGPASLRVGRHIRYRAEDIATWVDQQSDAAVGGNPPGRSKALSDRRIRFARRQS